MDFWQLYDLLRRFTPRDSDRAGDPLLSKRYAEAEAALRALSDRELADIGIHREQIAHAVRHGREEFTADA